MEFLLIAVQLINAASEHKGFYPLQVSSVSNVPVCFHCMRQYLTHTVSWQVVEPRWSLAPRISPLQGASVGVCS